MKSSTEGIHKAKSQLGHAPECRRQMCVDAVGGEAVMFVDGHDDAIIGVTEVDGEARVVYDSEAIIRKLMRRDGMDREGAVEFFEYNIAGVSCGASPALFVAWVR
jgi:hypothetical protein